ncbi:eukaryotic translation elongation factor 1 epsilon-1 [Danaus plexippus]|uniref:eukaryotic translation elongation factor 1 epsilon-1 n=1 Tax=Danaus plexippus TaxID=13037 RepID=UPI002AAF0DD8|nr:eukaryotic translation elongation factor 1 epsilon-1 [Danaus plexippus]
MDVIKYVGKYLNTPVGQVCYSTDKVLTTSLDKENIEGFATIILRLASKSGFIMGQEEILLSYQWLEHLAMYAKQASSNPSFAKLFLQGINKALARNTYLTGHHLNVTDVAAYHVLYPLIEQLSITEQESLLHLCRWSKHIQAQPKVSGSRPPLSLNTILLSSFAPAVH